MKHRHQLSMAQAPVPPYRLPVWANTGTTHQQLVAQPFSCEPKTTRGNPCSCIILINDPPYNYICNMQVRFHRNIAASSLAADCNVPQRPPAVIRSFTSIQIVHTHTLMGTLARSFADTYLSQFSLFYLVSPFNLMSMCCFVQASAPRFGKL